jgi:alkyl hydroperoxide reductase subunit F
LVLAILHSQGLGKLPDKVLQERIKRLAPGKLRTYVSLSCENCPDVVQSLNMIAILNGHIEHEMIDGAYFQAELAAKNIQGVPSVLLHDKLIHSGRGNFAELLDSLEQELGQSQPLDSKTSLGHYEVVVVGGGPAGASAAIYSARKGQRTALVAERMGGQVQDTKAIDNLISIPHTEGTQLAADLERHLRQYPVEIIEHRRIQEISKNERFSLSLKTGESLSADTLIIASGAKWRELGIPGEKEYIGRGVAFCPHCDGPYYKNKKVAVIGGGNSGIEAAIDLAGICSEVTVFEYLDQLKADQVLIDKLKSLAHVKLILSAKTQAIIGDGDKVTALRYENRDTGQVSDLSLDGVFVQIGLSPNSAFIKDLVKTNQMGEIIVDDKGRSSEPGIYAAGDVTNTPYKQIIIAMGEGAKVALAAFEDKMRQVAKL